MGAASAEPEICYLPPVLENGYYYCSVGTMYCREGVWSGCEGLRGYTLPANPVSALVGQVENVDPCNPNSWTTTTNPDDVEGHRPDAVDPAEAERLWSWSEEQVARNA